MQGIRLKLIHGYGHFGFLCSGKNHPEPPLAEPPSAENCNLSPIDICIKSAKKPSETVFIF